MYLNYIIGAYFLFVYIYPYRLKLDSASHIEMKYDVTLWLHTRASWKEKRTSFWCPFINTPSVQAHHHPLGKQWLGQKLTVTSAHALPSQPSVFAQTDAPADSLMIRNESLSDLLTLTSILTNISSLPLYFKQEQNSYLETSTLVEMVGMGIRYAKNKMS